MVTILISIRYQVIPLQDSVCALQCGCSLFLFPRLFWNVLEGTGLKKNNRFLAVWALIFWLFVSHLRLQYQGVRKSTHGWVQKQTGLLPRRPMFTSHVKPNVHLDPKVHLYVSYISSSPDIDVLSSFVSHSEAQGAVYPSATRTDEQHASQSFPKPTTRVLFLNVTCRRTRRGKKQEPFAPQRR